MFLSFSLLLLFCSHPLLLFAYLPLLSLCLTLPPLSYLQLFHPSPPLFFSWVIDASCFPLSPSLQLSLLHNFFFDIHLLHRLQHNAVSFLILMWLLCRRESREQGWCWGESTFKALSCIVFSFNMRKCVLVWINKEKKIKMLLLIAPKGPWWPLLAEIFYQ